MTGQPAGVQIVTPAGDRSHPWVARFVGAIARAVPTQFVDVGLSGRDLADIGDTLRCSPSMAEVHAQRSVQADDRRRRSLRAHQDDRGPGWRRIQIYTNTVADSYDIDVVFTDVLLDTLARSSRSIPGYSWNADDLTSAIGRERDVLNAANLILVPTQWLARDIRLNVDAALASKVVVVGWGPGNEFSTPAPAREGRGPATGDLSLVFIGNDGARKGLDQLIDAFREVRRKGIPVTLTAVGDLPPVEEPGVVTTGYVNTRTPRGREQFGQIMSDADVLVLPTTFEPVGCVFIEAMQAGLAVISNDVCGVGELVPPTCGWLVGRDAASLLEALELALEDSTLAARQRAATVAGASFTWDATARRVLESMTDHDRSGA